jgi:4-hydroxy-tetrahydrodipicolinate reductase
VSVRAGHEPGTHEVGFEGQHDAIRLSHRARGRGGFALGAVLAAEWIRGKRGLHGFDRVLRDFLRAGGRA